MGVRLWLASVSYQAQQSQQPTHSRPSRQTQVSATLLGWLGVGYIVALQDRQGRPFVIVCSSQAWHNHGWLRIPCIYVGPSHARLCERYVGSHQDVIQACLIDAVRHQDCRGSRPYPRSRRICLHVSTWYGPVVISRRYRHSSSRPLCPLFALPR